MALSSFVSRRVRKCHADGMLLRMPACLYARVPPRVALTNPTHAARSNTRPRPPATQHDGTHTDSGTRYFVAGGPTAGSFIRQKKLDPTLSLVDAIKVAPVIPWPYPPHPRRFATTITAFACAYSSHSSPLLTLLSHPPSTPPSARAHSFPTHTPAHITSHR